MIEITTGTKTASRWGMRTKVLAAGSVVAIGGGAAFAYWTAGGSGTGSGATDADTVGLSVKQTSTVAELRPGATPVTLSGNFDNTNDEPIYVGTVTASIASVTPAVLNGDCEVDDYVITGGAMTVNTQVPVGTAQGSWTGATIAFVNAAAENQDGCKGATVNLSYTIS